MAFSYDGVHADALKTRATGTSNRHVAARSLVGGVSITGLTGPRLPSASSIWRITGRARALPFKVPFGLGRGGDRSIAPASRNYARNAETQADSLAHVRTLKV